MNIVEKTIEHPYKPCMVEVSTIMRDKKKPYTVFSHYSIICGYSMIGIDDMVLTVDGTWTNYNPEREAKFSDVESLNKFAKEHGIKLIKKF